MNEESNNYRNYLISSRQKVQETIDKFLISISSGALGISIIFISNIIKDKEIYGKELLMTSWLLYVITLIAVISSFFTSGLAFRYAIRQVDEKDNSEKKFGGVWNIITSLLNITSFLAFIFATVTLLGFISNNF